jgi:TRAP-type C4-dicarboxylate transport system substrate-binding protein
LQNNPEDRRIALLSLSVLLLFVFMPRSAWTAPEYEIKLATLAPENSSLMRVFNDMNDELLKVTNGRVGFKMYAGFVLGDEADVLRKLRIGLINAATFTNTALTDINTDLRILQIPFLFNNYEEVDYILGKIQEDLKKGFSNQGFEVLGFPELGFIYFMSKQPIADLKDLKGKKVWAQANAPMAKAFVDSVGVSNVAITAPDVLMALQTNLVDVVYNSPYYALITQWFTQVKYFTDLPLSYIGASLLISKKAYDRLPAELQQTLKKVTAKYVQRLVDKTRQDNAEALKVMLNRGVKKITLTPDQAKGFRDLSQKVIGGLSAKVLPKDLLDEVTVELTSYRKSHPEKQ